MIPQRVHHHVGRTLAPARRRAMGSAEHRLIMVNPRRDTASERTPFANVAERHRLDWVIGARAIGVFCTVTRDPFPVLVALLSAVQEGRRS